MKKCRAVFVIKTCGGCGERGTSGSAAQHVALLLADGPLYVPKSKSEIVKSLTLLGVGDSHVYPPLVDLVKWKYAVVIQR